ncbi:hypothetical protein [Candidatus Magnetobacterium casense]|uniref:Uncharacterized protein n=1 Tax=Candidatus Magnetobacterium casense TaxID=1455061 RepID=A0ABS6RUP2_9BACT|nr:hypothetical protein [Candidatus Magnetobacterium casensis]MBV6340354.1 hypothetical protein [Candidatus Magnetobacterium casensis]
MKDEQKEKLKRLVPKILMDGPLTSDELMRKLKGRFTLRLSTLRILKTIQSDKGIIYDKQNKQFSLNLNGSALDTEFTQDASEYSLPILLDRKSGAAIGAGCLSTTTQENPTGKYSSKTSNVSKTQKTPNQKSASKEALNPKTTNEVRLKSSSTFQKR